MSSAERHEIVASIRAACEDAGLDLVHPFNSAECDWAALGPAAGTGALRPDALGLVIANTSALWPHFTSAVRADPLLAAAADPLDRYVTERVGSAVRRATSRPALLFFAHVTAPAAFPIQRLAAQVGLASLSPSHLAIHPQHGPWFALRAVVIVDVEGPAPPPHPPPGPCAPCSAPSVPALEHALSVTGPRLDSRAIAQNAQHWIAVRDACPVGRASRYGAAQLDYHYAPAAAKLVQGS